MSRFPEQLDHLVYAAPDLANAVAELEELLGLPLLPGGRHLAWGTRNAILPLGPGIYLEVIGPDPESTLPHGPALFGIDTLRAPRLVTWAAKGTDLADLSARARSQGVDLGNPAPGSRLRPDGTTVSWEATDPMQLRAGGIVPFFVDWRQGRHPAAVAEADAELLEFSAVHPSPEAVTGQLRALGLALDVSQGQAPGLIATLQTRDGAVELK